MGRVVAALRRRGMLDNSIIIFMTDNGGATHGTHYNRASNYPLRGVSVDITLIDSIRENTHIILMSFKIGIHRFSLILK